jgi:hypothetical protein
MVIDAIQRIRRHRGPLLLGVLLATVVTVPLLVPGSPGRVQAGGYGYKNKHRYNYAAIIARCKGSCGRTKSAILSCIGRGQKLADKNCRTAFKLDLANCVGDRVCKKDARSRMKLCVKSAGACARHQRRAISGMGNYCNRCCQRTRGSGGCQSGFSSSQFYGSQRSYGRLNCVVGDGGGACGGGSPSGALLPSVSDRIRSRLAFLVPWLVDGWSGASH